MWVLPAPPEPQSQLSAILDVIDKATKILAVFIGGGWVYLNYLRGRTFKHRLEPTISGKTMRSKGALFLSGLAQIKNVGLSKVLIQQRGTAVEVLSYTLPETQAEPPIVTNQDVTVRSVFKAHGWIEPGEQIEESFLIPIPDDRHTIAFRLALRIVSEHIEWNADSIVEVVPQELVVTANSIFPFTDVLQNRESEQRTRDIENKKGRS